MKFLLHLIGEYGLTESQVADVSSMESFVEHLEKEKSLLGVGAHYFVACYVKKILDLLSSHRVGISKTHFLGVFLIVVEAVYTGKVNRGAAKVAGVFGELFLNRATHYLKDNSNHRGCSLPRPISNQVLFHCKQTVFGCLNKIASPLKLESLLQSFGDEGANKLINFLWEGYKLFLYQGDCDLLRKSHQLQVWLSQIVDHHAGIMSADLSDEFKRWFLFSDRLYAKIEETFLSRERYSGRLFEIHDESKDSDEERESLGRFVEQRPLYDIYREVTCVLFKACFSEYRRLYYDEPGSVGQCIESQLVGLRIRNLSEGEVKDYILSAYEMVTSENLEGLMPLLATLKAELSQAMGVKKSLSTLRARVAQYFPKTGQQEEPVLESGPFASVRSSVPRGKIIEAGVDPYGPSKSCYWSLTPLESPGSGGVAAAETKP